MNKHGQKKRREERAAKAAVVRIGPTEVEYLGWSNDSMSALYIKDRYGYITCPPEVESAIVEPATRAVNLARQ